MMTDTANSVSVAEHTLAFMLALAKKIVEMDAMVRNGHWHERLMRDHIDLFGKTVLIIGFGRIGARTASRCVAMEMRVLVYDRTVSPEMIRAAGCEPITDMDDGRNDPRCRLRADHRYGRRHRSSRFRMHSLSENKSNDKPV